MKERGWIRIVEAFAMVLLMSGVFLMVLDNDSPNDVSQEIYEKEQEILREIQLNNPLRENILSFNVENLPVEWENFPQDLKEKIDSRTPSYLECKARICQTNSECILSEIITKNIYTQEVIISSTLDTYSPRKLKLFCWGI